MLSIPRGGDVHVIQDDIICMNIVLSLTISRHFPGENWEMDIRVIDYRHEAWRLVNSVPPAHRECCTYLQPQGPKFFSISHSTDSTVGNEIPLQKQKSTSKFSYKFQF